jgi:hypothetical protein
MVLLSYLCTGMITTQFENSPKNGNPSGIKSGALELLRDPYEG